MKLGVEEMEHFQLVGLKNFIFAIRPVYSCSVIITKFCSKRKGKKQIWGEWIERTKLEADWSVIEWK